jgi:hypothetical protein
MDTKTTLIVLFVVTCILYFSYSTSQAQAEENRSLRRTIDTLRVLMPAQQPQQQQQQQQQRRQQNLDPVENETDFTFAPREAPKKSPFPPKESDDNDTYGIGAGLETADPTQPLMPTGAAFPRALPMYA